MLVKAHMHDDALLHPPFLFIKNEILETLSKEPAKVCPRNSLSEKEQHKHETTAKKVAQHPWELHRCATYLRTGVEKTAGSERHPWR